MAGNAILNGKLRNKCTLKVPRPSSYFRCCAISGQRLCLVEDANYYAIEAFSLNGVNLRTVSNSAEWRHFYADARERIYSNWTMLDDGDALRIVFLRCAFWYVHDEHGDVQCVTMRRAPKIHIRERDAEARCDVIEETVSECASLIGEAGLHDEADCFKCSIIHSLTECAGHFYFVDFANNCVKMAMRCADETAEFGKWKWSTRALRTVSNETECVTGLCVLNENELIFVLKSALLVHFDTRHSALLHSVRFAAETDELRAVRSFPVLTGSLSLLVAVHFTEHFFEFEFCGASKRLALSARFA